MVSYFTECVDIEQHTLFLFLFSFYFYFSNDRSRSRKNYENILPVHLEHRLLQSCSRIWQAAVPPSFPRSKTLDYFLHCKLPKKKSIVFMGIFGILDKSVKTLEGCTQVQNEVVLFIDCLGFQNHLKLTLYVL